MKTGDIAYFSGEAVRIQRIETAGKLYSPTQDKPLVGTSRCPAALVRFLDRNELALVFTSNLDREAVERAKPDPSSTLTEENARAVAGITKLCEVELCVPTLIEATEGQKRMWRVKVSHVDRVNRNRRVYPREVLQAEIGRWESGDGRIPMSKGGLRGCVEHSYEGMKDACIIWREMQIEDDGAVYGKFEIVEKHTLGANLAAQIEAGMATGYSTSGRGSARTMDPDELRRYGLSPESDRDVVMIQPGFSLKRIDTVDDPSVWDAMRPGKDRAS